MNATHQLYCSAGTFTGRTNNRNHKLVMEYGHEICCDGFEIMVFNGWYEQLDSIMDDYKKSGVVCPVIHADKKIGDLVSCGETDSAAFDRLMELWKRNCNFGAEIGAKKAVVHLWGLPDSDKRWEQIVERCGELLAVARGYGLDMVVENIICGFGSPLAHVEELTRTYPGIGVTIDTRQAQFHEELERTCASSIWKEGFVRHLHISDFAGGYKDWDALYPITAPGSGNVNFPLFFNHLKNSGYSGTITLESPTVHREAGVDIDALNHCLDFVRRGLGRSADPS